MYPIAISFFENYDGETMQVYWSGPGIPRQLIPDSAFQTGGAAPAIAIANMINGNGYTQQAIAGATEKH